ncbi:hypothetical protein AQ731_21745 [Burkholderia pseudomallei]|nr:hypothetical protein [Burkholderia pseudomallei]KOS74239.1 hypothetical protein DM46_4927 [Burkholderia mallei]KGD54442.1 hypothetical protein DP49_2565 [Burkholderia pseudomallei]OMR89147.1 hypothetical protein AQ731_21745 [Burkholderia pseudomallei]CAJ3442341.1 Uncharacterised protein [Burkholderia pseudomallei]CAJ3530163.1 Uncharacterised protein [Burkholderia pseudomallei]
MSVSSGVPSSARTCSRDMPTCSCDAFSCDTKLPWTTVIRYGVMLCAIRWVTLSYDEQAASPTTATAAMTVLRTRLL